MKVDRVVAQSQIAFLTRLEPGDSAVSNYLTLYNAWCINKTTFSTKCSWAAAHYTAYILSTLRRFKWLQEIVETLNLAQRLYMFVCVQMCECINRLAEGWINGFLATCPALCWNWTTFNSQKKHLLLPPRTETCCTSSRHSGECNTQTTFTNSRLLATAWQRCI